MTTLEERIAKVNVGNPPQIKPMADFIRSELKNILEECVEMGEEMRDDGNDYYKPNHGEGLSERVEGYNDALSDFQSKLREKIEEYER